MKRIRPERLALAILFVTLGVFLSFGTILPRETATVFASPDETAVALFAQGWSIENGFRLPTGVPEAIADVPGLHPRSMVQQGNWLVPIGFLGMPMLALPFEKMLAGSSAFLTVLLVLSSVWPLWMFASRWSRRAALTASVVYLTFPTVLLYANRGLFPNLPVVALGLWSAWLVGRNEWWKVTIGGLLLGLALIIRPLEGAWLLPWIVWSFVREKEFKKIIKMPATAYVIIAALILPLIAYVASIQTYQSTTPTIGYWLRDTVDFIAPEPAGPTSSFIDVQPQNILPFGVHPRTMQVNIRVFWLAMLWPWVVLAFAGLVHLWWRNKISLRSPVLWLTVWTAAVLHLFYGQAIYLDNIRGVPAIGNSFLRYMLPLTPLIALAIGAWVDGVARNKIRTALTSAAIAALAVFGLWMALAQDEEGILKTQQELRRYTEIRREATHHLEPGTIIISERSDKIFAGLPGVVSISPLPINGAMGYALEQGVPVVLFHRELTEEQQAFIGMQFTELFAHDNERLYRVALPQ